MVEESLEVKLPTIWADAASSGEKQPEKRREEKKKEDQRRERVEWRERCKAREKVEKSRITPFSQ